jgi:hypothetical protein
MVAQVRGNKSGQRIASTTVTLNSSDTVHKGDWNRFEFQPGSPTLQKIED